MNYKLISSYRNICVKAGPCATLPKYTAAITALLKYVLYARTL
jgi:hypothetical protein